MTFVTWKSSGTALTTLFTVAGKVPRPNVPGQYFDRPENPLEWRWQRAEADERGANAAHGGPHDRWESR